MAGRGNPWPLDCFVPRNDERGVIARPKAVAIHGPWIASVIAYMDAPCLVNCFIDFGLNRRGCNRTFGL